MPAQLHLQRRLHHRVVPVLCLRLRLFNANHTSPTQRDVWFCLTPSSLLLCLRLRLFNANHASPTQRDVWFCLTPSSLLLYISLRGTGLGRQHLDCCIFMNLLRVIKWKINSCKISMTSVPSELTLCYSSEVRTEARLSLGSPRLSLESLSEHKALPRKFEQKQDCPSEVRAEAKLSLRSPRLSLESLSEHKALSRKFEQKQDCPSEVRAEAKLSLRSPSRSFEQKLRAEARLSLGSPRLSPESLNSNTHSTSARKIPAACIDGSNGCSSELRMEVHFYCVKKTPFRIAVVTGGNKGIGLEICRQLASNGIMVILTARDEKRGLEAVKNLKACGLSDVLFHQLDVTDQASIASMADFIKNKFGKLDILVNNAGISGGIIDEDAQKRLTLADIVSSNVKAEKFMEQSYEMGEACLGTNYYGVKLVTEEFIPLLQLSDSAKVVNVSSTLGQLELVLNEKAKKELSDTDSLTEEKVEEVLKRYLEDLKEDLLATKGWPVNCSAYIMSKAALNSYTRVLAKKYPNIVINAVSPGYVKTDLNYHRGILTVEEGAKGPVMLALLPNGGPSGLFYDQMEVSSF